MKRINKKEATSSNTKRSANNIESLMMLSRLDYNSLVVICVESLKNIERVLKDHSTPETVKDAYISAYYTVRTIYNKTILELNDRDAAEVSIMKLNQDFGFELEHVLAVI